MDMDGTDTMDMVSILILKKTKRLRKLKKKIITQFITIWLNVSLVVLVNYTINIKKCGKITMLKLLMVIIIKIIMDMLAMKELIMHGVIQHTPIITIIII